MKRQLLLALMIIAAATILVTGVAAHMPQISEAATHPTNAAFRDGMFAAKFDIEHGRKPHLSSGRWSTDANRAAYILGYHQQVAQSGSNAIAGLNDSEVAAYHAGRSDGSTHRTNAQPFQAGKTDTYGKANSPERQAYVSGYQLGYYVESATDATVDATVQSPRFIQSGATAR